jgi:TRAP-type mannitol/chloroaromatic compound transport system permease small subunit
VNALLKVSRAIDATTDAIGRWTSWLVLLMIALGLYNTLARYIGAQIGMNLTSNALTEMQWYLFAIIFFLGASYVLKHNEHVRVDFLYGNWPPRRKAMINFVGSLLFLLPFCLVVLFVSFTPVLISWGYNPVMGIWRSWEMSPDPGGLPRAPIKSMILIGFGLLFVQGISEAIKNAAILRGALQSSERTLEETYAPGALRPVTAE